MKYIQLGNTSTQVSKLGLGCINFGTTTDKKTAHALMDCYLTYGGNVIDTANNYAVWNGGDGRESERVIGSFVHSHPEIREKLVLCTKLGALPIDFAKGFDHMQGTGRQVILTEVEKSLDALKTDYIDLLYLHVDDYHVNQEETMGALNEVMQKGYVKHIGCSNFQTWRIERARQICARYNYPFFSAIQQRFSYFQPVSDADFFPQVCANKELEAYLDFYQDMTFFSHTSLLYGAYLKDTIEDSNYDTPQNRQRLLQLKAHDGHRIPWVLDYISQQFNGCVALFTSGSVKHLEENLKFSK